MLAPLFQGGRQPEKLLFGVPVDRRHGNQTGTALGQRSRLVDDQRVDLPHHLDCLGVLEQDARRGGLARRDHDRHRRRQAQCAGAGDDQDRDGVDQSVGHRRVRSPDGPDREGQNSDDDDRRNEVTGDLVGQFLDRRPGALSLGDHLNDAGQEGVGADPLGLDHQGARRVDRRTDDVVARSLGNGDGFGRTDLGVHRTGVTVRRNRRRRRRRGAPATGVARSDRFSVDRQPPERQGDLRRLSRGLGILFESFEAGRGAEEEHLTVSLDGTHGPLPIDRHAADRIDDRGLLSGGAV